MSEIIRKGFVNKNGDKVHIQPAPVASATEDHFVSFDKNGGFKDSTKKPSDFADKNHAHAYILFDPTGEVQSIFRFNNTGGAEINAFGSIKLYIESATAYDEVAINLSNIVNFKRVLQDVVAYIPDPICISQTAQGFEWDNNVDEEAQFLSIMKCCHPSRHEGVGVLKVVDTSSNTHYYPCFVQYELRTASSSALDVYDVSIYVGHTKLSASMTYTKQDQSYTLGFITKTTVTSIF